MRPRRIAKLLLYLSLVLCQSDSVSIPSLMWEYQLEGSGRMSGVGVRSGNGVVASQDESSLWITMSDGSMHILTNLVPRMIAEKIYIPTSFTGRNIECRSNVKLYEQDGKVVYGVYSVLDVGTTTSSRIICVDAAGKKRWEVILDGIAVGTPQIGVDGKVIYVTHNTGKDYLVGKLTMIQDELYGIATEIPLQGAGGFGFAEVDAPFGPVSVSTSGRRDCVYWGESWNEGNAAFGMLYKYSDGVVAGLRKTAWSTTSAPTLSQDGKSLWVEGGNGIFSAWTNGQSFSKHPTWYQDLSNSQSRSSSVVAQSKFLISSDGERAYSIVDSRTIMCLDAFSGIIIWKREENEQTCSSMKLSEDGTYLFVSHNVSEGLIQKFYAPTGRLLAVHKCDGSTTNDTCPQRIEGSFSISKDGTQLWFAEGRGNVVTLEFGTDVLTPTTSPSAAPTFMISQEPTRTPSSGPSIYPSIYPSPYPTRNPSSFPSMTSSVLPSSNPSIRVYMPQSESPSPGPSLTPSQISPAALFAPSMPSAGEPYVSSAGSPTVITVEAFNPSASPSVSDLQLSETPTRAKEGFMEFTGVDFDELLAESENEQYRQDTTPHEGTVITYAAYSALFAIALLFLMVTMTLGVLIGRLWQLKRMKALTLPSNINDDQYQRYETRYLVGKPQLG